MEEKEKAAIARAYGDLVEEYANALRRLHLTMPPATTAREDKSRLSGPWLNTVVIATILALILDVLVRILLTLKGL